MLIVEFSNNGSYTIGESDGSVEVCITINTTTAFLPSGGFFSFLLTTTPETAGENLMIVAFSLKVE